MLVHCSAGVSRSTTVIATTLVTETDQSVRETLEAVRQVWPVATPHRYLRWFAAVYVADQP